MRRSHLRTGIEDSAARGVLVSKGEAVLAFQEQMGWSQRTLANKLGVNVLTVSRWERDVTKPSPMAWKLFDNLQRMDHAMR